MDNIPSGAANSQTAMAVPFGVAQSSDGSGDLTWIILCQDNSVKSMRDEDLWGNKEFRQMIRNQQVPLDSQAKQADEGPHDPIFSTNSFEDFAIDPTLTQDPFDLASNIASRGALSGLFDDSILAAASSEYSAIEAAVTGDPSYRESMTSGFSHQPSTEATTTPTSGSATAGFSGCATTTTCLSTQASPHLTTTPAEPSTPVRSPIFSPFIPSTGISNIAADIASYESRSQSLGSPFSTPAPVLHSTMLSDAEMPPTPCPAPRNRRPFRVSKRCSKKPPSPAAYVLPSTPAYQFRVYDMGMMKTLMEGPIDSLYLELRRE